MSLYHRFKDRFGSAGVVIGVIALVMALVTGAYAAGGGLSGKQKKEVKKIAQQYAGKPGERGPAGANGTNGKDGAPGAAGAAGKSVKVTSTAPAGCPNQEGFTYEVEGSGDANEVCNGAPGPAGPTETILPPGKTLTGGWAFWNNGVPAYAVISFGLKLDHAPTFESNSKYVIPSGGPPSAQCPGSAADPTAAPGKLCVYINGSFNWNGTFSTKTAADKSSWIGQAGATNNAEEFRGTGSWAVTACPESDPECV